MMVKEKNMIRSNVIYVGNIDKKSFFWANRKI